MKIAQLRIVPCVVLFEQNNSTHREGSFVDGSIGGSGGDVCVVAMAYDWSVWISCECVMVMGGG